ncbi:MAG: rod shape-determining protein MreD [Clostridia bacterium]|nr:rod shape-determining protein MreD [Clostridia bacterium]
MKKFLIGIFMYIFFIFLYFLQSDFFSWFTIAGISPNIFIIFILFLGLFTNNKFSIVIAVLTGVTLDLVLGRALGITGLLYGLIAIIAGYFDKNFSKENKFTLVIMVIVITLACEVLNYFINAWALEISVEIVAFIKILAIETLYNVLLTLIFYQLILKAGMLLERQFRQKNILTRYF